jgi:hypothetical protein
MKVYELINELGKCPAGSEVVVDLSNLKVGRTVLVSPSENSDESTVIGAEEIE